MVYRLSQLLAAAQAGPGHVAKNHKDMTAQDFESGIEELALIAKQADETFESSFRRVISDDPRGQALYQASIIAREAALYRGEPESRTRVAAKQATTVALDSYVAKSKLPGETTAMAWRRLIHEDCEFAKMCDFVEGL